MNICSHLSTNRFSNFAKITIHLTLAACLFGCQSSRIATVSTTPNVEVQVLTGPFLTETPIPECVILPDVELSTDLLSENSIHIRITGLIPNETVQAIFSSKIKGQEREIIVTGPADEEGVFENSEGLRSDEIDSEFKDWQLSVVHSRGSTCTEIVLP